MITNYFPKRIYGIYPFPPPELLPFYSHICTEYLISNNCGLKDKCKFQHIYNKDLNNYNLYIPFNEFNRIVPTPTPDPKETYSFFPEYVCSKYSESKLCIPSSDNNCTYPHVKIICKDFLLCGICTNLKCKKSSYVHINLDQLAPLTLYFPSLSSPPPKNNIICPILTEEEQEDFLLLKKEEKEVSDFNLDVNLRWLLEKLDLEKHISTFIKHKVTMSMLKNWKSEDYKQVGIKIGPRMKIMKEIKLYYEEEEEEEQEQK